MTILGDNKLVKVLRNKSNADIPIVCKINNDVFVDSSVSHSLGDVVDAYIDKMAYSDRLDLGEEYADHVCVLQSDEKAFTSFYERSELDFDAAEREWENQDWSKVIVIEVEA
jgi:uncharacterized Fe-S radical SAM superfamily protein PflX